MASTYSNLKIELIGNGEQSGTWGTTTNTNLGTAIEEAIVGSADVSFSSADVTLTLTNTNAAQSARNLRLNLTGTSGGARNLILGSGCQIEKPYLINNGLVDTVTVKNTTGTGIAVPAGKTMWVFNNGTNVVDAVTHLTSLTLGSALPIASGGTGSTSTTFVNLATNVTGTLPIANGGTGSTSTTFVNLATNVTGTLPIANGGTGSTSTTFVNLATNVTGTLPIANGGTGSTSTTFVNLATNVTGTLPILNGGTGATTDSGARTALGATTVGSNFFTLTNPSAIRFIRINADNTVSALTDSDFRTAIGAGTGGGSVTSVSGTGTVNGITLTGTVTSSGSLTLGGTLTGVDLSTQVTGDLPFANLAQGSALSVLGVTGNATADVASIAAASDHQVLRRSGTSLAFGAVNLASTNAVTGTLPAGNGGTGITSLGTGIATWLGTPSSANLAAAVTDETGSGLLVFGTTPVITGLREKSAAVAASDIDLSLGNYFTKTISGTTTFTVSNVATSGDVAAFILLLTNGGSATVNFFSGVTWNNATPPTLTAAGLDILGFFTINGGTTWRGLVLAQAVA